MNDSTGGAWRRHFRGSEQVLERVALPAGGQVVVHSARSPDKDTANEDAAGVYLVDERRLVLAVADGVGGHADGQAASRIALDALAGALETARSGEEALREAILSGFDRANRAVLALGTGAATTLAAVEIEGGAVRTYHVGDAGVLVLGRRGRVRLQTIAHSPVGYALEAGYIDERRAMRHADRHIVSNVIGDPAMHVGLSSPLRLRPLDSVVLGSDGLFDNLYVEEIAAFLARGPLDRCVERIGAECRRRMDEPQRDRPSKPDDLTVLVYRGPRPARAARPA